LQAARTVYDLSAARKSGTFRIRRPDGATAPVFAELRSGWIHAVELSPAYSLVGAPPSRGEDRLRVFLGIARDPYTQHSFDAEEPSTRRGGVTPFHPAQVVRNVVDGERPDTGWVRERVGLGTVRVPVAPHASCLGNDERPLVAYLTRARSFAEIDGAALCPPERAARLLTFLDAVGAIEIRFAAGDSPYEALELPEGAGEEDVKRAFRRLARELHPDRHPGATPDAMRELERRFALVNAAYRRLV
jgi:hypothetical protein